MQTRRDVYLILFAMLLSWVVSSLQVVTNVLNWASFGAVNVLSWAGFVLGIALAGGFAYLVFLLIRKADNSIESKRQNERSTDMSNLTTELRGLRKDIVELKTEIEKRNRS